MARPSFATTTGLAVFDLIRGHGTNARAILCAFDLLEVNGEDIRREPIEGEWYEADVSAGPPGVLDGRALVAANCAARALSQDVARRLAAPADDGDRARQRCVTAAAIAVKPQPRRRAVQVAERGVGAGRVHRRYSTRAGRAASSRYRLCVGAGRGPMSRTSSESLPMHHYFPDPGHPDLAPFAETFVRMMFAHAGFEHRVSDLLNVITGDPSFGENPSTTRWSARDRKMAPQCIGKHSALTD
jgi:hypothetical protein